MLQQLWLLKLPYLFHPNRLAGRRVLELGAGTGVVPVSLFCDSGWAVPNAPIEWLTTDRAENLSLLQKNIDTRTSPYVNISVTELDWLEVVRFCHERRSPSMLDKFINSILSSYSPDVCKFPDLILCIDCVYNQALHDALVATLTTFSAPQHTVILLIMQLREVENTRAFLESWTSRDLFDIYALEASLLPPPLRQGYVAWVAWRRE